MSNADEFNTAFARALGSPTLLASAVVSNDNAQALPSHSTTSGAIVSALRAADTPSRVRLTGNGTLVLDMDDPPGGGEVTGLIIRLTNWLAANMGAGSAHLLVLGLEGLADAYSDFILVSGANGGNSGTDTFVVVGSWTRTEISSLNIGFDISSGDMTSVLEVDQLEVIPILAGVGMSPVVVGPILATLSEAKIASSVGGVDTPLTVFQNTANSFQWRLVNGEGDAIDLSGHSFEFVAFDARTGNIVFSTTSPSDNITTMVGESEVEDTVQYTTDPEDLATAAVLEYTFRDLTLDNVFGSGSFAIKRAPRPT